MTIENYLKKTLLFLSALAMITVKSFSQSTLNDGIAAFNKGLEERQAENYTEALNQFDEALRIADSLGDEGEELKIKVETLLPQVYYQIGMSLYNQKKIDEAIEKFKETIDMGNKYNDGDAVMKASNALSQLYYYKGSTNYKQENFNDALDYFRKAIEMQSDNVRAYYMIEAVYKSLDDDDSLMTAAKRSMEVAKASNDNKYYDGSLKLAKDYFLVKANSAKDAKKFEEALKYVKYSLEFDAESPTTYLLLVQIYSSMQNWDEEIAAAEKGLEYEKKDPAEQAKFYYEIGNAYKEKGDNEKACDAFKKASVGAFKESSEYQIQYVLKCG